MNLESAKRPDRPPASALVITLVILVLITVIVVGYLSSVTFESKAARSSLGEQKAHAMAMMGMHVAVAQLRDGLGPWDNPFANFMDYSGTAPTFFWSVSPGRLTRWDYTKIAPAQQIALFSGTSTYSGTTGLVNLNRAKSDGTYPIISGTTAVSVQWVPVLQNPAQAASGTNKVVGRYAFWIDDENAKININTADGTNKLDPTKSPGVGTPGEVSLQVLQQSGSAISGTIASNIVTIARSTGFQTPHEILRATLTSPDLYNSNVFNITSYNRSPEVNIFGDPKIYLIPAYASSGSASILATNGITKQPLTEIYPTPSQLPGFTGEDPVLGPVNPIANFTNKSPWANPVTGGPRPWPMVFMQNNPVADLTNDINFYQWNVEGFNVALIDKYLSGSNGAGSAITWPVFPGVTGTSGFMGKYSLRQLDSIAMQISDIAGKTISPEFGNSSNMNTFTAPTTTWGYLSGQLVSGIGRFAKVNELLMNVRAFPETGTVGQAGYTPPYITMTTYLEWYLPAGFAGMDLLNSTPNTNGSPAATGANVTYGDAARHDYLNLQDMPPSILIPNNTPSTMNSFWHDSLFKNNAGIDFLGNPPNTLTAPNPDPDQARAKIYHDPYALYSGTNAAYSGTYVGTGKAFPSSYSGLLKMYSIGTGYSTSSTYAWYPGMYWCMENQLPSTNFQMKVGTTSITFSGGLSVLSQGVSPRGDPDPVPLEAKRGQGSTFFTGEAYSASARTPGNPSETVLSRVTSSVIPVNFTITVPNTNAGDWWHAEVADALVNKFPGDWVTNSGTARTMSGTTSLPSNSVSAPSKGISRYYDGANAAATSNVHYDPDSYWLPTLSSTIPRCARMSNTGYLQYVRTGIIPDDESVAYSSQHGTPYRLLSFAPSTESASQTTANSSSKAYPDWAILDLFTIPSTVKPQGTYGGATSGRINPNGAVIYTTDVTTPAAGVSRDVPLQAILHGLMVNQTLTTSGSTSAWSGGTSVDEIAISQAIEKYVRTNGPLRMPGEICNISEIAALRPANNPTRNDLVRQIVGNLTTQSNVFSVWVAGQSVQKSLGNSNYGVFETGDRVLGEVRYHFIVERYLDPGADGIYGNTTSAGNDGVVGTWDDLGDPVNHPFEPRYLYRVVYSEEIQ